MDNRKESSAQGTTAPELAQPPQGQSAPKDGRPAASIREKPTVDAVTGSLSFTVPIHTSPGRDGFGPSLSLGYDSGLGNGPFGLGWHLNVESVSRKTSKHVPIYEGDTDVFVLSGFDDLVPSPIGEEELVGGFRIRRYEPRVVSQVTRIERCANEKDASDVYWRTISGENVTTIFGRTDGSRIFDSGEDNRKRIFSWLACESYDSRGNHTVFSYKAENTAGVPVDSPYEQNRTRCTGRYLKSIKYGNRKPNRDLETWKVLEDIPKDSNGWIFEVIFDYGEHDAISPSTAEAREWALRTDPFSTYTSGFEIRTHRLCQRVLMFHHMPEELKNVQDTLVSSTAFTYGEESGPGGGTLLKTCTQWGHTSGLSQSMPPMEFEYSLAPELANLRPILADTFSLLGMPTGISGKDTQWLDLDGEGSPGLLTQSDGAWRYQRNESALSGQSTFGPAQLLQTAPNVSASNCYFEDLDRNGHLDLVCVDAHDGHLRGYYTRTDEDGWTNFVPFTSLPNIDLQDPRTRRVDLTGDGIADIFCFTDDGLSTWYPSLATAGFGAKKTQARTGGGPKLLLGDEQSIVYIADMCGDGLQDIVHIGNSEIFYWPNMGHGTFGERVIMGNAPQMDHGDNFTHLRLRLVDVDGSGTTDLIYMPPGGGAVVYYNRGGNQWSNGYLLPSFPELDHLASVDAHDLLGQGTACLCWASPSSTTTGSTSVTLRYIDMMGGQKPGLLTKYSNGLGAETTVKYCPSTKYYLNDERKGSPWTTRLPFPVHCVERLVTNDLVAQTMATARYAYHDGYYDRVEREFRGFGMVEQWDAEDYSVSAGIKMFQRPPAYTKTWFHTGALLGGPSPAQTIPNSVIPDCTSASGLREAYRALKGLSIRQEVFSDDGSSKASSPYTVSEQNYEVQSIRASSTVGQNVFRVVPREELIYYCERLGMDDGRIKHEITLAVDLYGRITKSVSICYGRNNSPLSDSRDRAKQEETVIIYSEQDYTNDIDDTYNFHAPLPCESRRYRVLGFEHRQRFDYEYLVSDNYAFFHKAKEVPIEAVSSESGKTRQKALIARSRIYYCSADLCNRLPIGTLELYSTIDQSYELALTPSHFSGPLKKVLPDEADGDLRQEGGYTDLDNNNHWWIPSSRSLFAQDTTLNELQEARKGFYIPTVKVNPFNNATRRELDKYQLLTVKVVDTLGNTTHFSNDYVRLQPKVTTDLNGNRTEVALDCFGRVVGVAAMGKDEEGVGDNMDEFQVDLTEEQVEEFMQDPEGPYAKSLLRRAGRRKIYGTRRYWRSKTGGHTVLPAFEADITRDVHSTANVQIAVHITYLDGFGSAIQEATLEKAQQWRFSGWVIYDNKNQSVRQFLPFFASSHEFRFQYSSSSDVKSPATTLLRDPINRIVGALHPDHSWSKVRYTPWSSESFDAGDTVSIPDPSKDEDVGSYFQALDSESYLPTWHTRKHCSRDKWEQDAAEKSKTYDNTPQVEHFDTLGHIISSITDNGSAGKYTLRYAFDPLGNQVGAWNALDKQVTKACFDMASRCVYEAGMDNGERWVLSNCLGQPLVAWNSRDMQIRTTYDKLGRIVGRSLLDRPGGQTIQVLKIMYGEDQPDDVKENLRGKTYQCFDQAGVTTNVRFDFKGNCVCSQTQFAKDYKSNLDWSAVTAPLLEDPVYKRSAKFDALNREWETVAPDGGITRRSYNLGGNLQTVEFAHADSPTVWSTYIRSIKYSADKKRTWLEYGNNAYTEKTYSPDTCALINVKTWRSRKALRDLTYSYDCLGLITHTLDGALQDSYFRNNKITPSTDFRYDALGQLIEAHGREQVEVTNGGGHNLRSYSSTYKSTTIPGDASTLCEYTEKYSYDATGNILSMRHTATNNPGPAGWTRKYHYDEPSCLDPASKSNRLSNTTVGHLTEKYRYDNDAGKHGCMTSMPGYSFLSWDFNDRLWSSAKQLANSGTPETTWYVYNATGTRVRKVTECFTNGPSVPKKLKETRYLPDYELYRTYSGNSDIKLEKTTSHVTEGPGTNAIALIEYNTTTKLKLVRYQTSENLELDDHANVISYAEYSPYGAATYNSSNSDIEAPRKYRFARYERDDETGLYHCGERYYAPWLGRWTSPDPIGIGDGLNMFSYVHNDPINFEDGGGMCRHKKGKASYPEDEVDIKKDVRGSAEGLEPPKKGYTRIWRASWMESAHVAYSSSNYKPLLVRDGGSGDFNYKGQPATYFTDQLSRAMMSVIPERALIVVDIPTSELEGAKSFPGPDKIWKKTLHINKASTGPVENTTVGVVAAIGPESSKKSESFLAGKKFSKREMGVRDLEGISIYKRHPEGQKYSMQFAILDIDLLMKLPKFITRIILRRDSPLRQVDRPIGPAAGSSTHPQPRKNRNKRP